MRFRWFNIHAFNVTLIIFLLIVIGSRISVNWHFLNPLGNRIQDYDISDIVYSQIRDKTIELEDRIVLVNVGKPDRAKIARMIHRILEAQPKVIGVDVYFPDRQDPSVDSLLEIALKTGGQRIVLAESLGTYDEKPGIFHLNPVTDTLFSRHCRRGFINFPGNPTRTVRYFSPSERTVEGPLSAFSVELARSYEPASVQAEQLETNTPLRIHYSANEDHFIRLEAEMVLDTLTDLQIRLKEKIVILGYSGLGEWNDPMLDRHYTPLNALYTGKSPPDMFGFVIHANIARMVLDRQYIRKVPAWINYLIAFLICYLNVIVPLWIHGRLYAVYYLTSRLLQLAQLAGFFFLIAWMYDRFLLKWDFRVGFLALALVVDVQVSYTALFRHYRHRFVVWRVKKMK